MNVAEVAFLVRKACEKTKALPVVVVNFFRFSLFNAFEV